MGLKIIHTLKKGVFNLLFFIIILLGVGYVNLVIMTTYSAEKEMAVPNTKDVIIIDSDTDLIKPVSVNINETLSEQDAVLKPEEMAEPPAKHFTFSIFTLTALIFLIGLAVICFSFSMDDSLLKKIREQKRWRKFFGIRENSKTTALEKEAPSMDSMADMVSEIGDSLDDLAKTMDEVNETAARTLWKKERGYS